MSDIDYMRERLKDLQRAKAEREEKEQLKKMIKELEEEGTFKNTLKNGLIKVRDHLREKGKKLKDNGDRLKTKKDSLGGTWSPKVVQLSKESSFGTRKDILNASFNPSISKMINKKK